ncbi:sugar phosphate isomerase/epimerase family protein [Embleya scabrispora]|uniref:sugar phosphate isomerase/epimerase family protein n=1 Tax=Embleya scabrispora TaxID=159449 RepID=UPI00036DD84D|nr:sugar phosphate isomerase/epimerase family protein [Embleya scabrispora]MYS80611.1 TIM barrel protein [Streptomyces sp. SID5474]
MRAIGVNTWIWASPLTDADLIELAPRIREFGADMVELPLEQPDDWSPATVRKVLLDHDLAAASVAAVMPPGRDLVATDAAALGRTRDYLRRCVDAAAEVGAPVVAGPMYAAVGRTWRTTPAERARCLDELRDGLAPIAEHARSNGVVLAVEPLNRYETSLLNTVAQTAEAIAELPADAVGIALDTYHQNIEEHDLVTAVRTAGGRIAHVQVCANDRGTPGADHLDWPGFLTALQETGHQGPLCIESFTAHNASIAVAASIWRPLAATQDAIARDGIAFLRATLAAL